MSDYTKRRKELVQQIADLKLYAQHFSDEQRLMRLKRELMLLDSDHLRERAMRYGINLAEAVGPWHTVGDVMWLQEREQYIARQVIKDARFEWWKKWIALLSPVASVIIALLALLVSGLAIYLQLTRE